MSLIAFFAVAWLISIATAVADEGSARRPAAVPGVDGTYFVVPPDVARTLGDEVWKFWGEIEGREGEDDLVLLRRARLNAIERAHDLAQLELESGTITAEELLRVGGQLIGARLEAATTDAERLAAWEDYLPHMRRQEMEAIARLEIGGVQAGRPMDANLARAERMAAEIEVLKLRRKVYGHERSPVEAKRTGGTIAPPDPPTEFSPSDELDNVAPDSVDNKADIQP